MNLFQRFIVVAALLLSGFSCALADNEATGTVFITGANRGIGLELARQYTAAGWQVIGTARKPDGASELLALNAKVMQLDVTDHRSVANLAKELGDQAIDLLINNAGTLQMVPSIEKINIEDFSYTIAVNTVGPVRVTQALMPNLRSGKAKKVVNITSDLGSIAENTSGHFYGYRESKAALNMFTRSLAMDLRSEGFICVALHPGWVQTDMGGPNAPVPVAESAAGIRSVIDNLTAQDSGAFFAYDGQKVAW
jgi:NAD(P)-dependent dehydrogenase (short-subunit alcohol dehydrogenase family)